MSPSSIYRYNSHNTTVNCNRARIDNRACDARVNGKQIFKMRCHACLRPLKHSMLSSSSARKGEKGSAAIQGVGDEAGFVATVNTCKGVVLFELDLLNPLVRNLPRMMEVSGKIDIRDS